MVSLKIALQFIKKSKIHSFVIFLTVVIGVGVQFFVFSLGNILSSMILEQTTMYQNHLVVNSVNEESVAFSQFDYGLRDELRATFPEIKTAIYAGDVGGAISGEDGIYHPFSLSLCEPSEEGRDYREIYGLSKEENIVTGRVNDPSKNEIMLDDHFAQQSNLKVGETIVFTNGSLHQEFLIVGTFDLGIFKLARNYAYIAHTNFSQEVKVRESLKIQLYNPGAIEEVETKLRAYLNEKYTLDTWIANFPEMKLLDLAQKAVVLVIQILLSTAIFAIILSVLSFMIHQKEKQIGILKSLGLNNGGIFRIFIYMSMILTFGALIIGLAGGTSAIVFYHNYMRYPSGLHRFTLIINFSDYVYSSGLALIAVIIATVVAINKIRKSKIVELIR